MLIPTFNINANFIYIFFQSEKERWENKKLFIYSIKYIIASVSFN